jgi:ankyrin repeat protein
LDIPGESFGWPYTVNNTMGSRLGRLRTAESELDNRRLSFNGISDLHSLVWKYEMVLSERTNRQGYDSLDAKATLLSTDATLRRLGFTNRAVGQCIRFAEGYAYEVKRQLDPTDPRQHFRAIHLAASSGDNLAVRIALAAGYSAHEVARGDPSKHFDQTPLHLYAWYNEDPNECLDLLIDAGAIGLPVGQQQPSPASVAASRGHHRLLRAFERHYEDAFQEERLALIWLAFDGGQEETVKYLLETGSELALHHPVISPLTWRYIPEVELLNSALERGWVDVATAVINNGIGNKPPLRSPTAAGREAMARLLVRWADRDPDAQDELGQTQLSWAARLGHEAVVRLLIDWEEVRADSRDHSHRTPLSWAASYGHKGIVQILVERLDVEIDSKDVNGRTPLSYAAEGGEVKLLLENGANIQEPDFSGRTALHWAALCGHEASVRMLIEMGAAIDATDKSGRTALCAATISGYEAVGRLLIGSGANINRKDVAGLTPLWYAATEGHEALVRLLIEMGADVNATGGLSGETALHQAANRGYDVIARLLLENGTSINVKNVYKWTPLHSAASSGHEAVVRLLVDNCIDVNVKSTGGATACQIAAERGYDAIVDLLGGRNNTAEGRDRQLAPNNSIEWGARLKEARASFGIEAPISIKYSLHEESSQYVYPPTSHLNTMLF